MTRISAGLYANEQDFSAYAPQLGLTTFLVVGGGTRGDLNTPILVTSEADLVRKFGAPVLNDYGIHAAIRYLRKGARLRYVRVADATVATADAVVRGNTRAHGTIALAASAIPADGETITISDGTASIIFEFDSTGSVTAPRVPVQIVAGNATATLENLRAAIAASALLVEVSTVVGETDPTLKLVLKNYTAGVAIATTSAAVAVTGLTGGATNVALATFFAKTPGTWGNGLRVEVRASTALGASAYDRDVLVWASADLGAPLTIVERFSQVSLDPASPRYIELVVTEGIVNESRKSEYVKVDVAPLGSTSTVDTGVLAIGTVTLGSAGNTLGRDGIDGLVAADYIGTFSSGIATGLKAVRNPERVEFNLLAVPGVSDNAVLQEMKSLAAYRGDFLYLVDSPLGLDRDSVVDWHNGISTGIPNAPTAALDDSRGTLNWAWVLDYCPYNKRRLYLPPSGFVAANMAATDNTVGPWFIVAGPNRGKLDGEAVEYSPDREDRDILCQVNGVNRVNPLVNFADGGITLYGNRTLQIKPTQLSSVHARRLMLHVMKVTATATKYLVFEPNDPKTWEQYCDLVNPILGNIAANRGLSKFIVICDESTNPAAQRNNKTMKAKLKLEPIPGAEIIEQDFAVYDSGVEFTADN
jgi:phage tail sheath protein FI